MTDQGDWWATTNEERYSSGPYDSKEKAIEAFPVEYDLDEGDTFWVGRAVAYLVPSNPMDAEWVLESLCEQACAELDEIAEDWPGDPGKEAKDALEAELGEVIHRWLAKHNLMPSFFTIAEDSEHRAPAPEAAPCG